MTAVLSQEVTAADNEQKAKGNSIVIPPIISGESFLKKDSGRARMTENVTLFIPFAIPEIFIHRFVSFFLITTEFFSSKPCCLI